MFSARAAVACICDSSKPSRWVEDLRVETVCCLPKHAVVRVTLSAVLPTAREALKAALSATAGLAQLFSDEGYRLYLVGGVVREALAGRFTTKADLDCTTDARPHEVRLLVNKMATSVWAQGERFGTIGCIFEGRAFEITTHRAEYYQSDSRKPTVTFGDEVTADLARRDFTVNAMAVDTSDGALIDPYGGRDDLAAKLLRTPLDPEVSFADDPLRMLRAARFVAGHGFKPDQTLLDAVQALADRLEIVATERIRDEFEKLLLLRDPTEGFQFLAETGLLNRVIPEVSCDDLEKTARMVAATAPVSITRWAALFAGGSPAAASAGLRRLRCSRALIASVSALLQARNEVMSASGSYCDVRRIVYFCPVPVDDAVAFSAAVAQASGIPHSPVDAFAADLAELRASEDVDSLALPLDGAEVIAALAIKPGPKVGQALDFLLQQTFEQGPISKPQALAALKTWWAAHYGSGS